MPCPFLKAAVMLSCTRYPVRNMVPLDRISSAEPCLAQDYSRCPLLVAVRDACPAPEEEAAAAESEVRP